MYYNYDIVVDKFTKEENAMSKHKYISFDEFVANSGYKRDTVIKRCKKNEIPGITQKGDEYLVLSGTRYPYNIRRNKLNNSAKRRYILLKAISEFKYISHLELKMEKRQFSNMINELLEYGFIRKNNLSNKYGTNPYDCTIEGESFLDNCNTKKELACIAGTFVGATISAMNC